MKYLSILFTLLLSSGNVAADSVEKPFSVGLGTYATTIAFDNSTIRDSDYSGFSLSFGYAVSDNFLLRGSLFSTENDDFSDLTSKGYDLLAFFGTGLATEGFKAYIGGGLFKDRQELTIFNQTLSQTYNGLQLSGGLGYNWESVSLDLLIGIRDPGDYEDAFNSVSFTKTDVAVVSGSLLLSYRF